MSTVDDQGLNGFLEKPPVAKPPAEDAQEAKPGVAVAAPDFNPEVQAAQADLEKLEVADEASADVDAVPELAESIELAPDVQEEPAAVEEPLMGEAAAEAEPAAQAVVEPETPVETAEPAAVEPAAVEEEKEEQEEDRMAHLRSLVVSDTTQRTARVQAVADFKGTIKSALEKKRQAEALLAEQVQNLRQRISAETEAEAQRLDNLKQLLSIVGSEIEQKKAQIASEENLLVELERVRTQTKERIVLKQLDSACMKKAELIGIDMSLLADLQSIKIEVEMDLETSAGVLEKLKETAASLPSPEDKEGLRQFGWDDVEALQIQLADALVATGERVDRLNKLRARLDVADEQRCIALGVAKPTPSPADAARGQEKDSRIKRLEKLDRLMDTVKSETNEKKLLGTALDASLSSTGALVNAGAFGLRATQDLLESSGAAKAATAFGKAFGSLGQVPDGLKLTSSAVSEAWGKGTKDANTLNSIDQVVDSAFKGFMSIRKDAGVSLAIEVTKERLGLAGKSFGEAASGVAQSVVEVSDMESAVAARAALTDAVRFAREAITALGQAGMRFALEKNLLPQEKSTA